MKQKLEPICICWNAEAREKFQDGRKMYKLIHGDCLEKMKDIQDGSVDFD